MACLFQRADIQEELQKSQKVFAEKLNHLSRRLAWINATIYSKVRPLRPLRCVKCGFCCF